MSRQSDLIAGIEVAGPAIAAAIKARGGKLVSEPVDQSWGARTFNLVDPDGYRYLYGESSASPVQQITDPQQNVVATFSYVNFP